MTTAPMPPSLHPIDVALLRADATADVGVGHTMRLLALSQELLQRGTRVHLAGDLDIAWVAQAYADAGIAVHPRPHSPDDMVTLARTLHADVCVLDRYDLGPVWGQTLRKAGIPVMAMVDGPFSADQDADLYVDQNPGAVARSVVAEQVALAGAEFTLFRDDVLALRRDSAAECDSDADSYSGSRNLEPPTADQSTPPLRVLAVFGGTDPMGAAPVVTPLILAAADAVDLTVVSPDDAWANELTGALKATQRLNVVGPVTDLAARAVASDVVVTASGSSVWELLCLGVPIGVVCVIDNQTPGYAMVTEHDFAAGVGHLSALRIDPAAREAGVAALHTTFMDADVRQARVRRGQALLDGRGRERVADALERLVTG